MTIFGYIHFDNFDDKVEYTGRISLVVIRGLGSGLIDQSQKITVAARGMAEKKAIGHLS